MIRLSSSSFHSNQQLLLPCESRSLPSLLIDPDSLCFPSFYLLQFGGHLCTPILTLLTPITIYGLYFSCSSPSGCPAPFAQWIPNFLELDWLRGFLDPTAFLIYFGWYAFTVAAWKFLPGDLVEGTELRAGGRKTYKINGPFPRSSLRSFFSCPSLDFELISDSSL